VELRGFDFGKGRQPLSDAQRVDRESLKGVLRCIMADFGVVEAPSEGCAVRTGNLERDRIAQVASAVLAELKQRGVL
jgi:4-hydroxy-tetrahydrodipicolinate synthase